MIDLPLNYARVLYDMNIDPENLNKARSLLTESPANRKREMSSKKYFPNLFGVLSR